MGARTRRLSIVAVAVLVLGLVPVTAIAAAAPGDGDGAYGTNGFTAHHAPQGRDVALDVEPMPDGRLLVLSYRDHGTFVVTRLLPSGAPDAGFGGGDGAVELVLARGAITPDAARARLLVGADASTTVVAPGVAGFGDLHLLAARVTPAGAPDTAWAPGGTAALDVEGSPNGFGSLHLMPAGEPLALLGATVPGEPYRTVTYAIRVLPSLALDPRVDGDGVIEGQGVATVADGTGRWVAIEQTTEYPGDDRGQHNVLTITRRTAAGALDPTYGVGGTARVVLPRPALDGYVKVIASGSELVVGLGRGLLRIDAVGRLRTELGDGGVARTEEWIDDLVQLGDAVVTVGTLTTYDNGPQQRCLATRRYSSALVPDASWGDGGRTTTCPRSGTSTLVGSTTTNGRVALLTTSAAYSDRDDSATLTVLTGSGAVDTAFGSDGRVHLRYGNDGGTAAGSMALLPDGGTVVGIDAPDGLGVARVDASGRVVTSFGRQGYATSTVGAGRPQGPVALRPDGGTVVGGSTGVLAFSADGQPDPTFATNGFAPIDGGVDDLLVLPSGRIVVAARHGVVVLTADGHPDPSVAPDGLLLASWGTKALLPRGAGLVVITGGDTARAYGASLAPDPTFAGGGTVTAPAPGSSGRVVAATGSSGRIVVATYVGDDPHLVAFTGTGAVDTTFTSPDFDAVNPAAWAEVTAMDLDSLGRIVLGRRGGTDVVHLERLLPTGAHDPTFGDAGVLEVGSPLGAGTVVDLELDGQDRAIGVARSNHGSDVVSFRVDTRAIADLPTVSILDEAIVEDSRSHRSVRVVLDRPSRVPITVTLEAVDGTATQPRDYSGLTSGWFTSSSPPRVEIRAGATEGWIGVGVAADGDVEPDRTFSVRIVEAYQARIGDGTATVTIKDDDALRSLEAGNGFVRVGLGRPADEPADPEDPVVAGYFITALQQGQVASWYLTRADLPVTSLAGLRNGVPTEVIAVPFTADGRLLADRSGTVTPRANAPLGAQRPASAPLNYRVTAGNGHLTARWTPPADDGGNAVGAYFLIVHDAAGNFVDVGVTLADGRSFSFDRLENGHRYTVSMAPISGVGFGSGVAASAVPTSSGRAIGPPSAPSYLLAARSPDGRSANFIVGAPDDDGGAPMDRVTLQSFQHVKPGTSGSAPATAPYITLTDLDPALGVTYVVWSRNRRGETKMTLNQIPTG